MAFLVYALVASTMCFSIAGIIIAEDRGAQVHWPYLIAASLLWPLTLAFLTIAVLFVATSEAFKK